MLAVILAYGAVSSPAMADEWQGFLEIERLQYFKASPLGTSMYINRVSAQIETHQALTDHLNFDMRLYGSVNTAQASGNYFDPTIAKLSYTQGPFQLDLGWDIVYWGVVESQRIVNVINQADQIRDLEGDVPLGQPMLAVHYLGDSNTLSGFVLPRFVELNYGSEDLRLGFPLPVDGDSAIFEDSAGRDHVDYALRFSGYLGNLDYGFSIFDGTLRDPRMVLDPERAVLRPYYQLGSQFGLELQYTHRATLLKLEGRQVDVRVGDDFENLVYGIEYVVGTAFDTEIEWSLFAEHNWDSRGRKSPLALFQNDLFLGVRANFENTLQTRVTCGGYLDLDYGSLFARLKLETRLNDALNLEAVGYFVAAADNPEDRLYYGRDVNQIQLRLRWNF